MYPYEMVTLREIAAQSSVNVALIGRYYGSKKELFCAVLDSLSSDRLPLRPKDKLGDLADRTVRALETGHEDDSQLTLLNILMLSSQSREAMPVIQDRVKGFFTDMAATDGESSVPAGFVLTSCTLGVLMLRRLLPEGLSASRIRRRHAEGVADAAERSDRGNALMVPVGVLRRV